MVGDDVVALDWIFVLGGNAGWFISFLVFVALARLLFLADVNITRDIFRRRPANGLDFLE